MRHLALAAALLMLAGCQRGLPLMQRSPEAIAALAVSQPAAEIGQQVKALPKASGTAALTFLTYKALDNSLSDMAPVHLNILERAGSSASVNVLALVDRNQPGDMLRMVERVLPDHRTAHRMTDQYHLVGADLGADRFDRLREQLHREPVLRGH